MRVSIVFIVSALLFATICNADRLKYEPAAPVTVSGKISIRLDYGPPGYGEDMEHRDMQYPHLILTLDRPLCVDGMPSGAINSQSETNVSALQMVLSTNIHSSEMARPAHVNAKEHYFFSTSSYTVRYALNPRVGHRS